MVMTFVMKRAGRHKAMNAPEPPSSNGLRYLAVGVLGIAVLLIGVAALLRVSG